MPMAAIKTAIAANTPTIAALSRGCSAELASHWSIVRTVARGTSASGACTLRRLRGRPRDGRASHAGYGFERVEHRAIEQRRVVAQWIFVHWRRELERQQAPRFEPEPRMLQVEKRLNQQSRADEQHRRQGELGGGKAGPHPHARGAGSAT